MTAQDSTDELVAVGDCPDCGYVTGDDVDMEFPLPPTCNICGSDLSRATKAEESEVKTHAE